MQASAPVIDVLNDVLTAELTAVNQYFAHAKMCDNWGYHRLAHHNREESLGEMKDAERLIERILYLESVPNMQRLGSVSVGETVPEQLALDLELEKTAIARLNRGIATCLAEGDNGTRELLEAILEGEEQHADWLQTQLELIRQIGEARYLAQQLHSA
ncbi:MAG: bacterioferritin [Acidimicrobiia bacterium]